MADYLYILKCENEIKIGVSNDVEQRLKGVQTGNKNNVEIIHFEERDDAYRIESLLHKKFKKFRKKGEWFENLDPIIVRKELFKLIF